MDALKDYDLIPIELYSFTPLSHPADKVKMGELNAVDPPHLALKISDVVAPRTDQVRAFAQLALADGRLQLAHAEIEPDHVDDVGDAAPADDGFRVVADQADPFGEIIVVGGNDTALAGVDVLVVVQ